MNVTFRSFGHHLASSRYRAEIPQAQLASVGIKQGKDWLVIGKHGWSWDTETEGYSRVCFDICDDHFENEHGEHYKTCANRADLVTCNSNEMRRVIKEKTGRDSTVIPDPYEQFECSPKLHDSVLWFGHASNLKDLMPWADGIEKLTVVSNLKADGVVPWNFANMERAFTDCGLVIIPTGKSMAKSGNRAIEAIRRGFFVVAGYLPAYSDLGIYIGNIHDGIDWALSNPRMALRRIEESQRYVHEAYAPWRIGELWKKALSGCT